MNPHEREAVRSDSFEAPTHAAELRIVLKPATGTLDAPLAAAGHAIHLRRGLLPRWDRGRSHGRTADRPGDAVLADFYLAAEQAPQPGEPSYHVDQGLQRFSAWLDDQIEPEEPPGRPGSAGIARGTTGR